MDDEPFTRDDCWLPEVLSTPPFPVSIVTDLLLNVFTSFRNWHLYFYNLCFILQLDYILLMQIRV